jgi:hypothetical protein
LENSGSGYVVRRGHAHPEPLGWTLEPGHVSEEWSWTE